MLTSSFLFIFNQTSTTEIYTLPYTTLFRSKLGCPDKLVVGVVGDYSFEFLMEEVAVAVQYKVPYVLVMVNNGYMRSEEHTSELQSHSDLVCRLLLEKKKNRYAMRCKKERNY